MDNIAITQELVSKFGHKLRVRACGLCFQGDKILMIKHMGLGKDFLWAPPGGGVNFGEKASDALKREFLEETSLKIEVGDFCFACEYISGQLHAVELFFLTKPENYIISKGIDPEMSKNQTLTDLAFLSQAQIDETDRENLHGIFKICPDIVSLKHLRGYYTV